MTSQTVDTAMARRLVGAMAIQGASIIGQPGGWSVMLKLGKVEKPLGVQRTDKPRTWRSLDRCVDFLKNELHLARVDLLDATLHSDAAVAGKGRSDAAQRMRQAHQAAAYDKWFRAEVARGRPSAPARAGCDQRRELREAADLAFAEHALQVRLDGVARQAEPLREVVDRVRGERGGRDACLGLCEPVKRRERLGRD